MTGWAKLQAQLDPERLKRRFQAILPAAHARVGERFVAIATDRIDDRDYETNAPLTIALKGSDLPLVGEDGTLRGSITYNVRGAQRVDFGAKSPRLPGGQLLYAVLHEGATIKVTPRMRMAVMAKLREKEKSIKALKRKSAKRKKDLAWIQEAHAALKAFGDANPGASAYWTIPPRPFLREVWEDKTWRRFARKTYVDALEAILNAPQTSEA
ncbi:MAG: hypothetical protein AB7U23_13205 [Dehalococcoidia bacterium]